MGTAFNARLYSIISHEYRLNTVRVWHNRLWQAPFTLQDIIHRSGIFFWLVCLHSLETVQTVFTVISQQILRTRTAFDCLNEQLLFIDCFFFYQFGTEVPWTFTFRTYSINYHTIVLKSCQIVDQGNHAIFKSAKTSWDKLFVSALCNVMYEHAIIHV